MMASFGATLRRAREKKGISLEDVTARTRIPARLLRALEEESLSELPGGVYSRAYLKTYARDLGLAPGRLLEDYESEVRSQTHAGQVADAPSVQSTMQLMAGRQRSGWPLSGTVVQIAALAGLGVLVVLPMRMGMPGSSPSDTSDTAASPPPLVGETIGTLDARQTATTPVALEVSRVDLSEPEPPPVLEPHGTLVSSESPVLPPRLAVSRSGVGTDVVDSELVGRSDAFGPGTRVAFWTHVTGGRVGDRIRHVWFHEGQQVGTVTLPVGGPSWRTQSLRTPDPEARGIWAVEVQDDTGRVLARHEFRYSS